MGDRTAERLALRDAIRRCHDPKCRQFPWYGARGIAVVDEWRGPGGLDRFLAHIGPKPEPTLTLDRIDNDRGYEPGNVRWASRSLQSVNRSNNQRVTAFGREQTIAEWSAELDVPGTTIARRLGGGASPEEALRTDYARPRDRAARKRAQRRALERRAALARGRT